MAGGAERGTPIFGFQFHGHGNQQWKLERVKDGSVWPVYMIRNVQFGSKIHSPPAKFFGAVIQQLTKFMCSLH